MPVLPALVDELEKIARVAPHQQEARENCSAACLKAVLAHWGHDIPESVCAEVIGVGKHGAEVTDISSAARRMGMNAADIKFRSFGEARKFLDADIPIIADFQSWNHPGQGHYVVIVSVDGDRVEIMDPNTPGNWRSLSLKEVEERWWDYPMDGGKNAAPIKMWGVVVAPRRP